MNYAIEPAQLRNHVHRWADNTW